MENPYPSLSTQGVKCVMRIPSSSVSRLLTFQESCTKPSYVLYAMSLTRLNEYWLKEFRLPDQHIGIVVSKAVGVAVAETLKFPVVALLAGWALRMYS